MKNTISIQEPKNLKEVAIFLAASQDIVTKVCSYKKSAFNSNTNPSDAVVLNSTCPEKSIVISIKGLSNQSEKNKEDALISLFESIRDIVCSGGVPNGINNIVNFGNIKDFDDYQQLTEKLFDNSAQSALSSCSILGLIGTIENPKYHMTLDFKSKGHDLFLIGNAVEDINGSVYLNKYHQSPDSSVPYFDINEEFEVQKVIRDIIRKGFISSAHNVSKGGLFIALMESAMNNELGFDILTDSDIRPDAYLFGESQGRVLVSVDPKFETEFIDFMKFQNVQCTMLGHVTKGEFRIDDESFGFVGDYKKLY